MSKMTLREAGFLVKLVPFKHRAVAADILLPHIQRPKAMYGIRPTIQEWVEWATSPDKKRKVHV